VLALLPVVSSHMCIGVYCAHQVLHVFHSVNSTKAAE